MAQIPQINNPITSKNYNYSPRQQDANTEPFDIVKLTGVGGAGVNSDSASKSRLEMGNRELIPLQVQMAKDPTLAVEMLKDLLNVEVLNQALITGHTELYGSLENLAKELYVTPEELVQEIQNQEQQNTMFSGHEFYDVLREVAQTTQDPNTRELIGNLLKSINFAQNKNEILGALRANLKFLSEYYSPNEKLSEKLLNLSQEWGADDAEKYFDYLKGETLSILKDVSESLLNDDKTQMLIPLITHNLSRYNNSPYMSKEYFNLLLTQISSGTLRESLKNSFNRLFSAIYEKQPMQDPQNMRSMEDVGSMYGEDQSERQVPNYNYTTNLSQNQPLSPNSEGKNLNFNEQVNEIQQNYRNLNENFVENVDNTMPSSNETTAANLKNVGLTSDGENNLAEIEENSIPVFDKDGKFFGYLPNDPVYDEDGGLIEYHQPVFDDGGNRVGYQPQNPVFDEDGYQIEVEEAIFDKFGNQIVHKQSVVDENGDSITISSPIYNKNREPMPYRLPVFNKDGSRIGYQPLIADRDGNPVPFRQPVFSENGSRIGFQQPIYNNEGEPVLIDQPIFDQNGKPVISHEQVCDIDGNPISDHMEEEPYEITGWHKELNEIMSVQGYSQQLKTSGYNVEHLLASYNRGKISGMDAIREMVRGLFINSSDDPETEAQIDMMLEDFSKVNTMQELIDNLNSLLRDMPDIPMRERLYGVFVDIIEKMSVKNELPQHGVRPPVSSTLDNLTDFIQTNINNPALKSLDSFNAANLLQSLLNAPGVFTPLAHYILPLQVENTRAFGELWVDNDENNPNNTPGTQRNYHLFLTFDVESIGRFELDMYALGEDVNLTMLYPPRFEKEVDPMKERISKIIRNIGYQARTFETAPLKKPHNLVEIFPKITDKRTTLNKRV